MPQSVGIMASGWRATAVAASWSPLDLTGLVGWWDASDTTTITHSSNAVSQFDDKSGNGFHLTQSTAGNKPTTNTRTINALNTIDFDGTDDKLDRTGIGARTGTVGTWAVVVAIDNISPVYYQRLALSLADTGGTDYGGTTGVVPCAGHDAGTTKVAPFYGVGAAVPKVDVSDTNKHILITQRNGADWSIWLDGGTAVTGTAGTGAFNITRIRMGDAWHGGAALNGIVGEQIWAETTESITDLRNYLNAKWAVY